MVASGRRRTIANAIVIILQLSTLRPPTIAAAVPFRRRTEGGHGCHFSSNGLLLTPRQPLRGGTSPTAAIVPRGGAIPAAVGTSAASVPPQKLEAGGPLDRQNHRYELFRSPLQAMYFTSVGIVLAWVAVGTVAYMKMNGWPAATAYFYAVDAGMSIGFCTDVAERTVKSRAFSILFILLGASVVSGALSVFVADVMEGATQVITTEWRTILERDAFRAADRDGSGSLTYGELRGLLVRAGYQLSAEKMDKVCRGLDLHGHGCVTYGEFIGTFRGIGPLIRRAEKMAETPRLPRFVSTLVEAVSMSTPEAGKYRCFVAFFFWVGLGIIWGMTNQKWDLITSTHFAISALATGGLTAPPTNKDGVLPNSVALFLGTYCLFGIPLFYLTMGHFANSLVQKHLVEAEQRMVRTPLQVSSFC